MARCVGWIHTAGLCSRYAIQEERLLRTKRARVSAAFGSLAVRYCLEHAGISPAELSLVVVCTQRGRSLAAERLELTQLYRALFREGTNLRAAIEASRKKFRGAPAQALLDFVAASKRGICFDNGKAKATEEERDGP